jgi:hypothetical protein
VANPRNLNRTQTETDLEEGRPKTERPETEIHKSEIAAPGLSTAMFKVYSLSQKFLHFWAAIARYGSCHGAGDEVAFVSTSPSLQHRADREGLVPRHPE